MRTLLDSDTLFKWIVRTEVEYSKKYGVKPRGITLDFDHDRVMMDEVAQCITVNVNTETNNFERTLLGMEYGLPHGVSIPFLLKCGLEEGYIMPYTDGGIQYMNMSSALRVRDKVRDAIMEASSKGNEPTVVKLSPVTWWLLNTLRAYDHAVLMTDDTLYGVPFEIIPPTVSYQPYEIETETGIAYRQKEDSKQ